MPLPRIIPPKMARGRIQRRIDRLLDQIEEEADQLNWPAVLERAKAVLAYDPENQDAGSFLTAAERALAGTPTPTSQPTTSPPTRPAASHDPSSFANGR